MRMRLKSVPLGLAKPGMLVGKPVLNRQGQILIQEGMALTVESLHSLAKRQVHRVFVLSEELRSEEELAAERAKTVDRLNILFRNTEKTSSIELLYQTILEYRMEKLA